MAGAPKGNTNHKGRLFGNAIRKAVAQSDGEKLRRIAEKLLAMAEDGDIQAIREIGDRLDGKARQSLELDAEVRATVSGEPMNPKDWADQYTQ